MSAAGGVRLRAVADGERAAFLAMLAAYLEEIGAYGPAWEEAPDAAAYARAFGADPGGQSVEWIEADGERAGFLVTRVVADWPDEERAVGEAIECYVAPPHRRRGVGRAAVEAWLARLRAGGAASAEASVLARNASALAFWERLGFEARAVQTVRRP